MKRALLDLSPACALAALLLTIGCSSDETGAPGAQTTTTSGGGGDGGLPVVSGGSGGVGGVGGGGGAGGESLNICECLAGRSPDPATPNAPACAACFSDSVDTGRCVGPGQACLADPACKSIFDCLSATSYEEAQILACLPPLASEDPSHLTFYTAVNCICESCTVCESRAPLQCVSSGPPNCGCIVRTYQPGPCETCAANATTSACASQKAACDGNAGCASILACLEGCSDGDCVETCFGSTGTSYGLASAYFECTCSACVADCGTTQSCD